jgi:signal transduction histidine kinase/pSer/pThr/pTyr-binding forkhead associated (FHA) protein
VPSLFVIRGNDQGTRFDLEGETIGLGRESSNAVQLHDTEVSRQHAEFQRAENGYLLVDLNSSNGTFVNGKRVQQHRLTTGDQVQMGSTLMLYTSPPEESLEDLTGKVDISSRQAADEPSHIVRSVTPQEGSRLLDLRAEQAQNSWLARARGNLEVLYRTALAVGQTLDIDQLLQRILDHIFEWVEPDRGCIMLLDPAKKTLLPKVRRTRKEVGSDERITISKTIVDYVLEQNKGVVTSDARKDDRWNPAASILQAGIREAICVPMQGRYDVVGVIYIDTSTSPQQMIQQGGATKFGEDHLHLMMAIAHQAALAVEDTRYYSAMVQAERLAAIGQTMATVSHHIKNILQGVRGGSYLIEMGLKEHDESLVRKGWAIVEKNQTKITNLMMDMLTFSKEREPDLVPADVNRVVGDVVELMQLRAADTGVALDWHPADPMPTLVFDPEGLHRAVLNVVTNAIDAAADKEESGQVVVRAEYSPQEGLFRVAVEDNGDGIPPELMDSLFSPFLSTKKGRGTGLGLAVSQKIVQEHGGRILVESALKRGSRFTLELPAVVPSLTQQHTVAG